MMQKMRFNRFILVLMIFTLGMATITVFAQNKSVTFSETAEYDIGLYCPVASALDPSGTEIWLLMDNCGGYRYRLALYHVADGSQVDHYDYQDELASLSLSDDDLDYYIVIDAGTKPMAFTPEGDLSIQYFRDAYDEESSESTVTGYTVLIPLATGGEVTIQENTSLDALLSEYTEYFEYAVYNQTHTQIAIWGRSTVHIIDVATETEIAELAVDGDEDYTLLRFSQDGLSLQAARINDPDNFSDSTSTLSIYSLADGELLQEYTLPTFLITLSPDETLAALNVGSNDGETSELFMMDLATGSMSARINLYEDPTRVTKCVDTGNDVSDLDYVTRGIFYTPEVHWLPDNRTLVAGFSYGGDASNNCVFDYSRLRVYSVSIGE